MKKYIVLSVNDNPDYLYFTPLCEWAWKQFGWEPILFFAGELNNVAKFVLFPDGSPSTRAFMIHPMPYKSSTVAQVSRLYASFLGADNMIMTGDIDMLPLSDYWHPNPEEKTVYGFDLTNKTEVPICYVAMKGKHWESVMRTASNMLPSNDYNAMIRFDLDKSPNAKSEDFYKVWGVDQQILTSRLLPHNPVHVLRGQYPNGYACGRVDRGNWSLSHSTFIDAHLFQQVYHKGREQYFEKTMELLRAMWPEEDFTWFETYTQEFKRLTGHA